jgi:queuine tRNA-ribosyltransferase
LINPLVLATYIVEICKMKFELQKADNQTKARAGKITTDHGEILTPIFMPVGTAGTVKGLHTREILNDVEAQIILGNTYHLFLRPGLTIVEKAGGLHKFNGWNKPILTDSGGYQVFSLKEIRKITEEGVYFNSHIDGSKHLFTPEYVIDIQRIIGGDIIMAFDECPPYPCDFNYAQKSMHLTHRWLQRCVKRMDETEPKYGHSQALFPIVQGSIFKDLRIQSAEFIAAQNQQGNAIGGLSVGEPAAEMYEMLEIVNGILPENKPRYLMGVGTPENILEAIALGTDMFDCVMPTRNARNGMLFTTQGIINIRNKKWEDDFTPIDEELGGYVSTFYSKAYLKHLIKCQEMLGAQIASIHNLRFYLWLVTEARKHILEGDFAIWKATMVKKLMQRI